MEKKDAWTNEKFRNTQIGERIKSLRKTRGLTQQELGTMIGLTGSNLSKYETGEIGTINVKVINKLAAIFNVSQSYLLDFTNDPTPSHLSDLATLDRVALEYGEAAKETLDNFLQTNKNGRFLLVQISKAFATSSVYSLTKSDTLAAVANNLYLQEEQAKLKK